MPNERIKFESGLGKPGKSPSFGTVVFRILDIPTILTERIEL